MVDISPGDVQYVTTALLQIYRDFDQVYSLQGWAVPVSWPWICHALQLPSPSGLLHLSRLRYFGQIMASGADELWAMIEVQGTLASRVQGILRMALWEHQCHDSTLPHPADPSRWNEWSTHSYFNRPKEMERPFDEGMETWHVPDGTTTMWWPKGTANLRKHSTSLTSPTQADWKHQPMVATQHICLSLHQKLLFEDRDGLRMLSKCMAALIRQGNTHMVRNAKHVSGNFGNTVDYSTIWSTRLDAEPGWHKQG